MEIPIPGKMVFILKWTSEVHIGTVESRYHCTHCMHILCEGILQVHLDAVHPLLLAERTLLRAYHIDVMGNKTQGKATRLAGPMRLEPGSQALLGRVRTCGAREGEWGINSLTPGRCGSDLKNVISEHVTYWGQTCKLWAVYIRI